MHTCEISILTYVFKRQISFLIFKLSHNVIGDKQDIGGDKCVKKDDGSITFSDAEKP